MLIFSCYTRNPYTFVFSSMSYPKKKSCILQQLVCKIGQEKKSIVLKKKNLHKVCKQEDSASDLDPHLIHLYKFVLASLKCIL